MKLSAKYLKIVEQLSKNAREPASQIAKRAGVSKDVAVYAIHSLQEKQIITKFITLIDTQKLGYTIYELYIKLQSNQDEKQLIEYLKRHPSCLWVRSALGEWDILTEFYAKDIHDYENIIREIDSKYGKSIKRIDSSAVLKEHSFPLKLLGHQEESIAQKKPSEQHPLNPIDCIILNELAENARVNVTDIAINAKLSPDAIAHRIKKLVNEGVILGYRAILDESALGYTKYKLMVKLRGIDGKTKATFLTYLKRHRATQYIKLCIGEWDLSITLLAKDVTELRDIVNDIKTHLKDALDDYSLIILLDEYKSTYFPEVLSRQSKIL